MRLALLLAGLTLGTVVLLVLLGAAFLDRLGFANRPTTPISGIALGDVYNRTVIPRHALQCRDPDVSRPWIEECSIAIDGSLLTIEVEYHAPSSRRLEFMHCAATYGTTRAACRAAFYAIGGSYPLYASVPAVPPGAPHVSQHWFGPGAGVGQAVISHVEVRAEALEAFKRQYPFDNYFEADWMALIGKVSTLAAASVGVLTVLLIGSVRRRGSLDASWRATAVQCLTAAAFCGGLVFCLSYLALTLNAMGAGLVD